MAKKKKTAKKRSDKYGMLIQYVFDKHYKNGMSEFEFERTEIEEAAKSLGISVAKNIGDVPYSFRYRRQLPSAILETQSDEREWVIEGAGIARYRFRLAKINRVIPSESAYQIKIPDATPEIITLYAKSDEQALLAKVRYNRLIDVFLRVTAYSLQSHLRTTVPDIGQIEIDEVYVGVRNTGQQFIIPVQAKGGNDKIGAIQVAQDFAYCRNAYPSLTPKTIAVQFMAADVIAMFELVFQDDELKVADEKHYKLVSGVEISDDDLRTMAELSD